MKKILGIMIGILLFSAPAQAASFPKLTLKTDWKIWDVNFNYINIHSDYNKLRFHGLDVDLGEEANINLSEEVRTETVSGIDVMKIQDYLKRGIAEEISRDPEDVTVSLDENEEVVFEGNGFYGRKLDIEKAAFLIKEALENGQTKFVNLPIIREEPEVTIVNKKLRDMGITDLVSSGETSFTGSPYNRRNNIRVGLSKFDGHIIPVGEEFTFGDVLGPVEDYTGYLPELVIKGDKTVPEYGGGLCQVSTTAYRAILAGGYPVTKRRNHSYSVQYYAPVGLDATVYPPIVDLKFINDSPGALLMQSFTIGDKAYYNLYGTKDSRKVAMIGPYYTDYKKPPEPRIEYTTELAPGERKEFGHAVPGLTANWYRQVTFEEEGKEPYFEHIYSRYQARPDFFAIGVSSEESATQDALLQRGY